MEGLPWCHLQDLQLGQLSVRHGYSDIWPVIITNTLVSVVTRHALSSVHPLFVVITLPCWNAEHVTRGGNDGTSAIPYLIPESHLTCFQVGLLGYSCWHFFHTASMWIVQSCCTQSLVIMVSKVLHLLLSTALLVFWPHFWQELSRDSDSTRGLNW
jgi:hypothetical protein